MHPRIPAIRTIAACAATTMLLAFAAGGCARPASATWAQKLPALRPAPPDARAVTAPRIMARRPIELAARDDDAAAHP